MSNQCEYYPCHSGLFQGFSCELCYCPEYTIEGCSGTPKFIKLGRSSVKDCSDCLVPHQPDYVTKYYKEKKNGKDDCREVLS